MAVTDANAPDELEPLSDDLLKVVSGITDLLRLWKTRIRGFTADIDPDLTPAAFWVIRHVVDHGPVSHTEVVNALKIDKTVVSRQVKLLKVRGLVDTEADPHDGRSSLLIATPLARDKMRAVRTKANDEYIRRFADWSTEDMQTFSTLLARFNSGSSEALRLD